ncbi:cupin domain-containing protein [Planomicrobium okeanokoites]|uniref:cupin domain-containing protein n=1 Tax=Planomicrobium okeanokoites TaxID=244 RepID=UPI002490682E|nr:cupin domain-containing protein [Planomicrobium okeanokoites]
MELFEMPNQLDNKKKHVQKVAKFEKTNIVNMQLAAGEEISEHDADADVLIIVNSGRVEFTVEGTVAEVSTGVMMRMTPKEKHSLKAIEDSNFLVIQIKQ